MAEKQNREKPAAWRNRKHIKRQNITQQKIEYVKYISSLLLFGSNGIIAGQTNLPSAEIVFWRTMIGTILLAAVFAAGRRRPVCTKYRFDLLMIILSGIAMGLSWIFLYEAYARIGVSLSSLAYYCGPVIVMILSPVLFQEKLTASKIFGFSLVLPGVILTNGTVSGNIDHIGIACGLMSALMHSLMVIFSKKAGSIKGLENSMIQLAVSFLTVAVYMAGWSELTLTVGSADLPWILILGLFNTGIGCWLYFSSIEYLSVQSVSVLGYLEPLSAVLLAVIILHEKLDPLQWAGAALIIGGALAGERKTKQ